MPLLFARPLCAHGSIFEQLCLIYTTNKISNILISTFFFLKNVLNNDQFWIVRAQERI